MNAEQSILHELAARVRAGDEGALAEFRGHLEGQMVPLVRQALGGGPAAPRFRAEVLATAGRLARYAPDQPPDRERLARRVASCLCDCVCERLGGGLSPAQRARETVLA